MNKFLVIGLSLALGIGIYLMVRDSGDETQVDKKKSVAQAEPAEREESRGSSQPAADYRPRPSLDTAPPVRAASGEEEDGVRRYQREDGSEVRDHRGGSAPAPNLDRHPSIPASISKVQPETLVAVRKSVQPAMEDCIEQHRAGADSGAKAQAVLTVSVKDEQLRVDKVKVQTAGVADHEEFVECVNQAMIGHEQSVAGGNDVQAHHMTFPYSF